MSYLGFAGSNNPTANFNTGRTTEELANIQDEVDTLNGYVDQDVTTTGTPTFAGIIISAIDVTDNSSPPTDAELDAAFGEPAALGDGYICIYDKNDANTDVFLCITRDATWQYVQLSTA